MLQQWFDSLMGNSSSSGGASNWERMLHEYYRDAKGKLKNPGEGPFSGAGMGMQDFSGDALNQSFRPVGNMQNSSGIDELFKLAALRGDQRGQRAQPQQYQHPMLRSLLGG